MLGKPLINEIVNGAQPIDQFVFRDKDGSYYMYYGGWGHCNMVKLADDFKSIVPFPDGSLYKEVTPKDYTEGSISCLRRTGNTISCGARATGPWTVTGGIRDRRLPVRTVRTRRHDSGIRP